MRTKYLYALALPVVLPLLNSTPAGAADRVAKLTIEVKARGSQSAANEQGTDISSSKFSQRFVMSTKLSTNGDLSDYNSKDPAAAQRKMNEAARVAQAVQKAHGVKYSKPLTQEEMQRQLQADYARCGADQSCLMALAQKASQMTTQLYAQQAPAQEVPEEEEEPKEIFMQYFGYDNCGSEFRVEIDESSSGRYADVQGMVPFSSSSNANYTGDDIQRRMICNTYNVVLDTERKEIWLDGISVPSARGSSTYSDGLHGKTAVAEQEMSMRGEVMTWVNEQMRHAPMSGTRKTTLRPTGTNGLHVPAGNRSQGSIEVELTWRFEDI